MVRKIVFPILFLAVILVLSCLDMVLLIPRLAGKKIPKNKG